MRNKRILLQIIGESIPFVTGTKYLAINLDIKLIWQEHINKKKNELEIKSRNLARLIGRKWQMTVANLQENLKVCLAIWCATMVVLQIK